MLHGFIQNQTQNFIEFIKINTWLDVVILKVIVDLEQIGGSNQWE